MELFIIYLLVGIVVLAYTDASNVVLKILLFPARIAGHIILWIVAIAATPLIIWNMAKAIKERDQQIEH